MIDNHGVGGVYPDLFRAALRQFNWSYTDRMPPFPRIQGFAGFTLRLLARHGREPRLVTFYSDAFIRAFPMMVDEARDSGEGRWDLPARSLARAYIHRSFERFGHLMGLVHVVHHRRRDLEEADIVETTPLFREFIRFHV